MFNLWFILKLVDFLLLSIVRIRIILESPKTLALPLESNSQAYLPYLCGIKV